MSFEIHMKYHYLIHEANRISPSPSLLVGLNAEENLATYVSATQTTQAQEPFDGETTMKISAWSSDGKLLI
jgi:hypothetical protein